MNGAPRYYGLSCSAFTVGSWLADAMSGQLPTDPGAHHAVAVGIVLPRGAFQFSRG